MISQNLKDMVAKLHLPYEAVALKMCFEMPDCKHFDGKKSAFCTYVNYAQKTGEKFYITVDDDECYGKLVMGMIDKPPVTASGQAGYDFGCYATPGACRNLYQNLPILEPHTIHFVEFCPVSKCDFDPDMLMFVCDMPSADIVMRATSWISGDPWESKSSPVLSCAWMYAYPIISGKCNHITTGFYHGLKRRKLYPEGLRMIAVPYQRIPEFEKALSEMDWTLIAFREDEESKKDLAKRINHWQEMAASYGGHVDLKDER